MKKRTNDINFIFGMLNKKEVALCLFLEAFLDFIYFVVPFTFTFLLTLPFTLKKAIIVTAVFIVSKGLRAVGNYALRKISDNYLYEYSNVQYLEYYKKLTKIPTETLSKYQTGYLQNIIEKITSLVKKILRAEYVSIVLSFLFFFYTAYNQSIILFAISLVLSILCVLLSVKILKRANNTLEELYEQDYEYSSLYQDYISNIRTVKALNNNKYFQNNIKTEADKCYVKNKKYVGYYSFEELVRNVLIVIPFALAIIKAVIDLSNGIDTLGIITFYISLHIEMGFIFDELSNTIVSWFELKAIKGKITDIFKKLDNRKVIKTFDKLTLDNINIHYAESNFDIKVPSLILEKNDKICILGKSGQGKTSILNLLLGDIDSYSGNITIDNYKLSDCRLDIGIVSQEIELFNMSIKDNLCLGKNISDEDLIAYIKELELNEILMFKDGIYTLVGEKGLKLSTGQKRRINLLRSYLMDKDVYVLDEPTSNLDEQTEKVVVKFILNHFTDKTLIIATHNKEIKKTCTKFYEVQNHILAEQEDVLTEAL